MNQGPARVHEFPSMLNNLSDEVSDLRAQRAGLVADIAKLNDELLALSQKLEQARKNSASEISDAERLRQESLATARQLRQEGQALRQAIDSLEPKKRHLEAEVADRQAQLERQTKEANDLRRTVSEYEKQLTEARDLWTEVIHHLDDDTKKLESARREVEQLEPRRVEAKMLDDRIQKAKLEHYQVTEELRRIESDAGEARGKLATLEANLDSRRREEMDLLRGHNEMELANTKLRLEREHLEGRIGDLKAEFRNLTEQVDQILEKKIHAEKDLQQTAFRLKAYQASVEPLRESIEQKQKEQERLGRDIDNARGVLREISDQTLDREKRLDLLTERMTEMQGIIHRHESTIESLHREENELRTQLEKRKLALAAAEREHEEVRRGTSQLEKQRADLELDLRAQREVVARLDEEILRLQKDISHLDGRRQELDKQCGELEGQRDELQAQKQKTVHEIERLQSEAGSLQTSISEATARLDTIHAAREQLQESNVDLERQLAKNRDALAKIETEIAERTANLNDLRERVHLVESDIERLRQEENREKERHLKLETRTHEISAEIANREARLQELQDQDRFAKASLAGTHKRKEELLETIRQLESQESALLGRIDSARQELGRTEEARRACDEKIEHLSRKIRKLDDIIQGGLRRREALAASLKREGEAIAQARERLRELETQKAEKLNELQSLRLAPRESGESGESPQQLDESARIRADAERTLTSLRRRLSETNGKKTTE